jgi:hypothetical protein
MNHQTREKGLIKAILLVVIALIMLSYMGIDLEKAVAEPLFKKNLQYSGELIKKGWDKIMDLVSKDSEAKALKIDIGDDEEFVDLLNL